VIRDPRTDFHPAEDKRVVVHFEWLGPPGLHRFEGSWRSPNAETVVVTRFDYRAAASQFAAVFELPLSETMAPGEWVLDVTIDGEPAGSHAVRLSGTPRSTPAGSRARQILTSAEIYERALGAIVRIEALDAEGTLINAGSGVVYKGGTVLSSLRVIDGAARLRARFPGGRWEDLKGILAWNRHADWVLLASPIDQSAPLPFAADSMKIGERCASLDTTGDTAGVLVEGAVLGVSQHGQAGPRAIGGIPGMPRGPGAGGRGAPAPPAPPGPPGKPMSSRWETSGRLSAASSTSTS
jgi:hypothetical protein